MDNPRQRGLNTHWTHNIKDQKEKEKFVTDLKVTLNSAAIRRLIDMIEELELALRRKEMDIKEFDNPSWALKEAFIIGKLHSLNHIKDLIKYD